MSTLRAEFALDIFPTAFGAVPGRVGHLGSAFGTEFTGDVHFAALRAVPACLGLGFLCAALRAEFTLDVSLAATAIPSG